MKTEIHRLLILLLLLAGTQSLTAQEKLKFSVSEFGSDSFDTTAKDERYKRIDGSGSLYAIIKVTSDSPNDNLNEYNFNFGNMNCIVENHDDQLWLYVQKNAKMVTITRSGYNPIRNYDLHSTIEAGRTYVMHLSAQGPVIRTQMVMFTVKPANSKAVVMIREEGSNHEETMLGIADASGVVVKNMPFGTYTYRIVSENYNSSEGRITLNNQEETYQEEVTLRPRFSQITLTVNGDAEIFLNGESKGRSTWTGILNAGIYQVECRRHNHRNSTQSITVEENVSRTIELTPPTPIVGTLSLISTPIGASIKIDGNDYGKTPRNITNLLIGQHELMLSLNGYDDTQAFVEVKENETAELNITLSDAGASLKKAKDLYDNKEYSSAVEIYQRLANRGNNEAQCHLGRCYENGRGVDKDLQKAFEWYEKSANKGNAEAQNLLGICFRFGQGVAKDLKRAVEWFEKSANQGHPWSQYYLGNCYREGRGIVKDLQKAFEWYEKAANQGIAHAQFALGNCYETGRGVDKDLQKAFEWYEKAANQGHRVRDYLGKFFEYGIGVEQDLHIGVEQDLQKAFEWYEKSANKGNAEAQYHLGFCYESGIGVEQDLQKAVEWYEKSDYADASNRLGLFYEYGIGVEQDLQKAFEWYEKSANKGDAEAQCYVGRFYENKGWETRLNFYKNKAGTEKLDEKEEQKVFEWYKKAFEWYEKSANQGNKAAQKNIAYLYEKGIGVEKDLKKADYWRQKMNETVVSNTSYYNEGEVFEIVEQNPMFPGGNEVLMKWLSKNLKYPVSAQENGIQGRVLVQFVVNKDGSIVEPKVLHSVDPVLDKEALRVVSTMPKWQPGKQRGKTVRVRLTLPVTFRLM